MSSKVTQEMDDLEAQRVYFAHMMRLHDLKIKRIKAQLNLEEVMDEIVKMETALEKLNAT